MKARMKKVWFSVVAVVMLVVVLISATAITASADTEVDYSFYNLSSTAASYMNKVFSPSKPDGYSIVLHGPSTSNSVGNAGTYIGYCDSERTGGLIYGWLMSTLSSSSSTYSYASFKDAGTYPHFYYYTQYGNLLTQLGLDSTSTEGGDFLRYIGGGLMLFAYLLSISVVGIFSIVFSVLKIFNPFNIFAGIPKVAEYLGYTSNPDSIFASAFGTVSSWYNAITNLSWYVVVPLFFVFLVLSLLLLRTANRAAKVKKYIIRIAFIAIGVPVCAALYTGCLNSMVSTLANGSTTAPTKVIVSTFVDFEAWTVKSQLCPPDNGVFAIDNGRNTRGGGGVVSNASYTNLRNTCMYINAESNAISGFTTANILGSSYSGDGSLTYGDIDTEGTGSFISKGISDTLSLLKRYTENEFYHASDWESQCKNRISNDSTWQDWFKDMSNEDNWKNDPDDGKFTDNSIADSLLFDGGLVYGNTSAYGAPVYEYSSDTSKGLSTLSMYNYLSTKFTDSSVVVYSNEKSSSGFVRESHHSVNLIGGSGIMSLLYYINAFVLLMAYSVIGWFYAISMCITNLKRGIKSIASIPFAMLGSIPAIAKTITYVIMLIVEIIGTFFVYGLVSELIFSVNNMIEGLLTAAFNSVSNIFATIPVGDTQGVILSSPIVMSLVIIAQCIFIIWFTVMAVKLRKSIVRTMDEFVGNFIDRLFDVSNTSMPAPKQPGALSRGAGAVAAGVGMGAGQRMGNNLMNKNVQSTSSPQGTARGSASDTSAGGGSVDNSVDIVDINNVGGTNDIADSAQSGSSVSQLGNGSQSSISASSVEGGSGAVSGGETPGAGAAVGKATDAMFAENNQEQADKSMGERMEQMSSLGSDTKSEKEEEQAIKDAQADRDMQAMMGQTSALADEQYDADKKAAEKEIKKEAQTRAVKAGAQTLVGVGEVVGGVLVEDPSLIQDGAKNTANGAGGLMDANKQARHADTNAAATAMQQEQQRESVRNVDSNSMNNTYGEQSSNAVVSSVDNSSVADSQNVDSQATDNNNLVSNTANEQNVRGVQNDLNSNVNRNDAVNEGNIDNSSNKNSVQTVSGVTSNNTDNVSSTQSMKNVQSAADTNMSYTSATDVNTSNTSAMGTNVSHTAVSGNADNNSVSVKGGTNNTAQNSNTQNSSLNKSAATANSVKTNSSKTNMSSASVSNATASNTNNVKKNVSNSKSVRPNADNAGNKKSGSKSATQNVTNKPVKTNKVSVRQSGSNKSATTVQKQSSTKSATVRGEQARKTVAQQQRSSQAQSNQVRSNSQQRYNNNSVTQFNRQSVQQGRVQHNNNVRQANGSVQRQNVVGQNRVVYRDNSTQNSAVQRNLNTKVQQNIQRTDVQTQRKAQTVAFGSRTLVSKGVSSDSGVDDII